MKRRTFLKTGKALGLFTVLPIGTGMVSSEHKSLKSNIDSPYSAPPITDRLDQGLYTTYGRRATAPENYLVMVTSPSDAQISNFGMGMVTYMCDEKGPPKVLNEKLYNAMEALARWPLGDKLYLRVDWRDIQKQKGKLEFPEHWKITFELAKKYNKRVGLRVQLMSPDIERQSMPDFLADKVPLIKLGTTDEIGIPGKVHYAPRYDDENFMEAFKELDDLLSDQYNGHELVEYVDTYMYGFWGEGHTWPFMGNSFPDYITAEKASIALFEHQAKNWTKTPLTTNTQPDYSAVGNAAVLDRTLRSFNWLRTDTIFIETEQIEALSNRPPWIGATIENGFSDGKSIRMIGNLTHTDMIITHIKDVSPTYCSLWNWHNLSADNLQRYYDKYPDKLNSLTKQIGYRVRPSWIWYYEEEGYPFLILGMANDGLSGVPGALRVYISDLNKTFKIGGSLDPGYPLPGKIRQVRIPLPKGTNWIGLKLSAEIEVKGMRYPVNWACEQPVDEYGALTLVQNT
jgi:hypothetical protein